MEDPGQKLKAARERMGMRYRDVEECSQQIAERRRNGEYAVTISRLADIENRGVIPSIFKIYSLCAIYRLEIVEVMRWYGIEPGLLATDASLLTPLRTHLISFGREDVGDYPAGDVQVPLSLDPGLDVSKTTFLSRYIRSWGTLPLMLLSSLDLRHHRYAYIGTDDWFMYPLLQPGSLLLIDESRKKIRESGWHSEYDRPLYFLEHRDGWLCSWCGVSGDTLIAIPHPVSGAVPRIFEYPADVEVIGQVMGVANRFDRSPHRRRRS